MPTTAPLRRRVAVLVEAERSEQAVRDLRREHLLDHVAARAVRVTDRVEHDRRGLAAVDRVRVDRLAVQVVLGEVRPRTPCRALELVDRLAGDGHVHARRRAEPASSIVCWVVKPSGREQLDVAVVRPEHRDLVLDHLGAVLVRSGRRGRRRRRRCAWIFLNSASYEEAFGSHAAKPAISMPSDFAAFSEVRRDAEAVGLLVVQDVDLLDALRLARTPRRRHPGTRRSRPRGRSCACPTGSTCPARSCRSRARPASGRRTCWPARSSRSRRPAPG